MQQSLHVLTHTSKDSTIDLNDITEQADFYKPIVSKDGPTELGHYNLINLDRDIVQKVVKVYNPSIRRRTQLVRVYVSTYHVEVI